MDNVIKQKSYYKLTKKNSAIKESIESILSKWQENHAISCVPRVLNDVAAPCFYLNFRHAKWDQVLLRVFHIYSDPHPVHTHTHNMTPMCSDPYYSGPHTQSDPYAQWSLCTVTPHTELPLCTVTPMYSEPYVQWSICTVTPKQWTLCAVIHMYSNPPHIYSEPDVQWSIFTVTSIHTLTPMYSDQYIEWPNTHSDPYLCSAHYVQ